MIKNLEVQHGVTCSTEVRDYHAPCHLSQEIIAVIDKAAHEMGILAKRMNSGAGHDAMNIAEKVKTAMIFVPTVNGISHSPLEWTNWEDVEKGIRVLTRTMQDLSGN